ncbi:MAG: DUF3488 and transglutaminase-like domain-containing protein [Mariprofundaceae bacterium]
MISTHPYSSRLILVERLTLAVLLSGVASLALSDFVSPFYWGVVVLVSAVRLWYGPGFSLTEMQASMIGWAGFVWVGLELLLGRALVVAFTDFLLILSLAIVIEEATPRNQLHRMLTGFFLILGAAVLTDSVLYVIPLACFIWFVWRASQSLYGMQLAGDDLPLKSWRSDVKVVLGMTVITGLLFIMLPRFDFQTYLKPVQPRMQTSGFSSKVQLGDFARTLDATVVLRVEAVGEEPELFRKKMMGRYWRGLSLVRYSGNGWEAVPEKRLTHWQKGSNASLTDRASDLKFAVYREASDHLFVFVPDGLKKIVQIPASLNLDDQGSIRFNASPSRRMRIVMQSAGRTPLLDQLRAPLPQESSQSSVPEELTRWTELVVGDLAGSSEKLNQLMMELKGWEYDLNAPVDDESPVASFLELKRGHCELYATTLALAARSMGIPSRVVNGYYGGEWNELGGFYLIRQQHAHSWVEAWVDGRWQRFDPTPASRWQLSAIRFPALDEVWESVKLSWYRYVLEFQDSDRSQTFKSLISLLKTYAWWVVLIVAGIGFIVLLRRSGFTLPRFSMSRGLYAMLDRWLVKRGVERELYQPLRYLSAPAGVQEEKWQEFIRRWEHQAYGENKSWSRWELKRHLRALS